MLITGIKDEYESRKRNCIKWQCLTLSVQSIIIGLITRMCVKWIDVVVVVVVATFSKRWQQWKYTEYRIGPLSMYENVVTYKPDTRILLSCKYRTESAYDFTKIGDGIFWLYAERNINKIGKNTYIHFTYSDHVLYSVFQVYKMQYNIEFMYIYDLECLCTQNMIILQRLFSPFFWHSLLLQSLSFFIHLIWFFCEFFLCSSFIGCFSIFMLPYSL